MQRKVAIVTGSSAGIGAATVRLFARNGFDVAINYSRNPARAEEVAQQCRALGADVLVVRADVAQDEPCRALASAVEEKWGRADALVNNAGTTKFVSSKHLEGLSAGDFQDIYAVNAVGPYQTIRAFVPLLRRNAGSAVVNVSSMSAFTGVGSSIAYVASKGALNALTVAMARALAPDIRVNAVVPGMVETDWLREGMGEERFEAARNAYAGTAALRSAVKPEDVADACYWLCTGAAKTTGELLLVDGGFARFPVMR